MGRNASIAVMDGKDAEEMDGFEFNIGKVGVHLDVVVEGGPECPVLVGGESSGRYDSSMSRCRRSVEISTEFIALGSRQRVQPAAWG